MKGKVTPVEIYKNIWVPWLEFSDISDTKMDWKPVDIVCVVEKMIVEGNVQGPLAVLQL